jgi:hemoglobin/transferrin/lactoferrin receptor protein
MVSLMKSTAFLPLLLGLVSMPVAAQLETVTVTATRIPTRIMDVPATVTVKDSEAMDRELVFSFEDLLRYEPGVSMRNEGGRFGASGPSIRGIGGNRVLMEVDGVRLPDAFAIGSFANAGRDMMDTDLLKRVEIVRGSASSLYGSDAIGGVLAFTTKDPEDVMGVDGRPGFSVKGGYSGRDDSSMAGATFAGRIGAWSALLAYTHRDGHEIRNRGEVAGVGALRTEPVPQDHYSDSVLTKFVFDASESQRVRLTLEGTRDDLFTDVLSSVSAVAPVPGGVADDLATRQRRAAQVTRRARSRVRSRERPLARSRRVAPLLAAQRDFAGNARAPSERLFLRGCHAAGALAGLRVRAEGNGWRGDAVRQLRDRRRRTHACLRHRIRRDPHRTASHGTADESRNGYHE